MDCAFLVRPNDGTDQEPLRYALRALMNVTNFNPDRDQVWLIGDRPTWATNIHHIPGNHPGSKGPNIFDNWRQYCHHADNDEFAAFNDDMYALTPTAVAGDEWQEPLAARVDREPAGWWRRSLQATLDYCRTLTPQPRSFELHRPVLMRRGQLGEALDKAATWWTQGEPPQWRSVYGNTWNTGRTRVPDVKVKHRNAPDTHEPWISTSPPSWRAHTGQHIRQTFPEPCQYERG